jgi:glycosyltransferase involved in cell wall biosynthesis
MNIALNAVAFSPGRMGGVETYFRNLVRSLQVADTVNDYYVVCNRRYIDSLLISNPNFTPLPSWFAKPSPLWYLRVALRDTVGLDVLRPIMNRLDMDIMHHPFSFLNPMDLKIPSVLTFIDMQHEYFPEYFSSHALNFRRALYRSSAEKAVRIIAISEHAKTCLVEKYGINPDKIDAIHIGYDPQFRVIDDPALLQSVRSKYGLHKPFMYYPAATWPHKNHKKLLAALKIMKDNSSFDGQLVLSGIAMQVNDAVLEEISRLGLHDDVVVLGYLPSEELPCLYSLARLMVFPSLYEGFGIPLVEAMACGCPVVCSHVTSIPEVVGDAALTFDPDSAEEMAEQILSLWTDDSLRQDLRAKGLARVKLFTWGNMAHQTIQAYEKAMA